MNVNSIEKRIFCGFSLTNSNWSGVDCGIDLLRIGYKVWRTWQLNFRNKSDRKVVNGFSVVNWYKM